MHVRPRQTSASRVRGCSRSRTCVRPPSLAKVAFTAGVLAAATIGLVPQARAQLQNAPVDLELFRPAMDSKGFVTVNSSAVLGQWDVSFGLVTSYARRPLQFTGTAPFGRPAEHVLGRHPGPPVAAGRGRLPEPPAPRRRARHHRPDGRRRRAAACPETNGTTTGVDVRQPGPGRHPDPSQAAPPERDPPGPRLRDHAVGHPRHRRQELVPGRGEDDLPADGDPRHRARLPGPLPRRHQRRHAHPRLVLDLHEQRRQLHHARRCPAARTSPPAVRSRSGTRSSAAGPLVRHRAAEVRHRRRAVRQLRPRLRTAPTPTGARGRR